MSASLGSVEARPRRERSPADLLGATLGGHEILIRLAAGGMGSVYVARSVRSGGFEKLVAIKTCHPHLREDPEFVAMFRDEARLSALVRDPHVVPTLDVGDAEGVLHLVMEYVEGVRLADLARAARKKGSRMPLPIALRVIADMLTGLEAAHEARSLDGTPLNLVHRDVSPQNVLVGSDGVSRIMDFGIAKARARATVTREGLLKGKLGYMPPESFASGPLDRRADLFAAGVVLWEAITCEPLFHGDSEPETVQRVLHMPVPEMGLDATAELALAPIVRRALERVPADRYSSAIEMLDAIERTGLAIASPRDVARYVRREHGQDLDAQRDKIRAAITDAESLPRRPDAVSSSAPVIAAASAPVAPSTASDGEGPPTRSWPWVAIGLGALGLLVAIIAAASMSARPDAVPRGEAPTGAATTTAPTTTTAPATTPTAPTTATAPTTVTPATSAPTTAASTGAARAGADENAPVGAERRRVRRRVRTAPTKSAPAPRRPATGQPYDPVVL
jgi:serine/threonine protein kinase